MIMYNVNEEKKTVVAYFDGGYGYWFDCAISMIQKMFSKSGFTIYPYNVVTKYLEGRTLVGKAKCHENDTWNEEYGKQLARKRLLDNWDKFKDSLMDEIENIVNKEYVKIKSRIASHRIEIPF